LHEIAGESVQKLVQAHHHYGGLPGPKGSEMLRLLLQLSGDF
jgi:hypothetical protein